MTSRFEIIRRYIGLPGGQVTENMWGSTATIEEAHKEVEKALSHELNELRGRGSREGYGTLFAIVLRANVEHPTLRDIRTRGIKEAEYRM